MFRKLKISLSKPAFVFAFVKDRAFQVIKYLLFIILLMTLPAIIAAFNKPGMLFPSNQTITSGIQKNFLDDGYAIVDNKLVNPNNISKRFFTSEYIIVVGEKGQDSSGVVIQFSEEAIDIYMQVGTFSKQQYSSIKYENTNLNDIVFNAENASKISYSILDVLKDDTMLRTMKVFQIYFANLVEYLFIALLLTLLFKMGNRLSLPFKNSFVISIYLTSVWAITMLILTLFNIRFLSFLPIVIAYIYHILAYRSIKTIRTIQGGKDNENK